MFLCAECKRKSVYIDNTGQPAEFCSNQCRKTAVEQRHVQPCIKCRTWPMVRLPDGSRSPFCGKHCQNLAGVSSPVRPMPLQQQPPYRPAMMTSPQLNQSNPPIGMPPHPIQILPGGNARPMGGPWVMATVPFCRNCHVKPCWKDTINQTYSSYCSRTCKEAAERGAPRVVSNMNNAPFTPHQNYNVSPVSAGSPVSPVQTNGILSPLYHHQQPPYQQNNIQQQSQLPNFTQQQQLPNFTQQQQQSQLSNFTQQQQQSQLSNFTQFQQPQPQNPSNNIQHPRPLPSENPLQTQMNDNSQYRTNNNSQRRQSDDIQQSPASNSSQNSQASGHHIRYHNTDTPISHPQTNSNSQPSDSQTPPPIPTNKPTVQIHPQHINPPIPINITINTSPSSSQEMHPPSPPLKKIPDPQSPPQAQIQEQNQPHSPVQTQEQSQSQSQNRRNSQQSQSRPQSQGQPQLQSLSQSQSQPQSPSQPRSPSRPQSQQLQNQPQPPNLAQQQNHSQPQPQLDGIHPEINGDSFILTPYVINQDDPPPQYTPNDTYAPSGEDISIRKVTRDDSFDDENPYGFRNVNNNNSNDQDNNNPEQRTQHNPSRWRRL